LTNKPRFILDAASIATIDLIASQFEPPQSIRHLLLPPNPDPQHPDRISLSALQAMASCSGLQQNASKQFLATYEPLWGLVGGDFVSKANLRHVLMQVPAPRAFLW
jgi:hypothetical protein